MNKRISSRFDESIPTEAMKARAFIALERKNSEEAQELFKRLAALGWEFAYLCLGNMYFGGEGGAKIDIIQAKEWYERAFSSSREKLSQEAAIKLGYIYEAGYDAEGQRSDFAVDNQKAFNYYRSLENSNNALGLLRLGNMYELGKGTPQNQDKALSLYKRIAGRHVLALKGLGALKVKNGQPISGYILWACAILEAGFLMIFKRNSPRIRV